jgi:hypothetical protein
MCTVHIFIPCNWIGIMLINVFLIRFDDYIIKKTGVAGSSSRFILSLLKF